MQNINSTSCNRCPCDKYTSHVWTPPWRQCNPCPICPPPCPPYQPQPYPPCSCPQPCPCPPQCPCPPPYQLPCPCPPQPCPCPPPCPQPPCPPNKPQRDCDEVMWLLIGYWIGNNNCRK